MTLSVNKKGQPSTKAYTMSSKHCDTCSCARHCATCSCQPSPSDETSTPPDTTKTNRNTSSDVSPVDHNNYDEYNPEHYEESSLCREIIKFPRHPIIAAARKNARHSLIYGLPESVLQRIIGLLDGCSIESLRRASRIFLRLCPIVFPENYSHTRTTPQPQLKERPSGWPDIRSNNRLKSLIRKTLFCRGCRKARETSGWEKRLNQLRGLLFCDICLTDHPSYLFSARERNNKTGIRSCIAYEGFIRLCDHSEAEIHLSNIEVGLTRLCGRDSHKRPPESTAEDVYTHMRDIFYPSKNFYQHNDGSYRLRLNWTEHTLHTKPELLEETFSSFLGRELASACRKIFPPGLIKLLRLDSPTLNSFDFVHKRSAAINWWATNELKHCNSDRYPLRYKVYAMWIGCLLTMACQDQDRKCKVTRCHRELEVFENDGVSVSREWYQALNQESYSLRDDEEGFQVYWCNEEHCANYYKFSLARILTKENGL